MSGYAPTESKTKTKSTSSSEGGASRGAASGHAVVPAKFPLPPEFKRKLQELRRTDNTTNWFYLARTYLAIALVVGGTIAFYQYRAESGISWLWNAPVTFLAILVVGALQHHLATLAHEAVHRVLFKNRYLNDLASEWLCSFPIFGSSFHYGLHHLAHHQYVNDPELDPDISQLELSGHRLTFPILQQEFLQVLMRQLWLPNLFRYTRARAEYDSLGTDKNPYIREGWKPTKTLARVCLGYLIGLIATLAGLVLLGDPMLLAAIPVAGWLGIMAVLRLMPDEVYYQSRIQPLFSVRTLTMMRISFFSLVFTGLAWGTWATGHPWWLYFLVLWVVPLVSSFPFYMVLRQIVQHGNADRGWFTNSRVFDCNPLINFAIFSLGQDYHLPHHMYATVPHYRLKALHEALLDLPEYREQATVVEGYLVPRHRPPTKPTVVEVLGPKYAPGSGNAIFIDDSVLEGQRMDPPRG
ncbi:fatty acid desaturase family protein [Candidatus Laterigemmans baculatus]|uniref:fatty acid desaturase family protein n=1 Tax=Candidatus Laterigemmans baculatus TaxID=2770505 RepID=UPI0013DB24F9|nr:fatty acid desaturase [Candidatus Laterigemmans baculatus]